MENWKVITEFKNYEISDFGRVGNVKTGKVLKPETVRGGHQMVILYKEGKTYGRTVHRLVLETFVGPCPAGSPGSFRMEGSHLDNDPSNNCLSNLVWESHKDNMMRSKKVGRHPNSHSEEQRNKTSLALKGQLAWNKGKPSLMKGKPRSEETKNKISAALKGKKLSEDHKNKISEANKGRPAWNKGRTYSNETKRKMKLSLKGRHLSDETRKKMSLAKKGKVSPMKGKYLSEEHKRKVSEGLKKYWVEKHYDEP